MKSKKAEKTRDLSMIAALVTPNAEEKIVMEWMVDYQKELIEFQKAKFEEFIDM